ncbi:hypothetical protein [Hymenobacter negativus]|uniref:Phage tail tape measure protein n=1 Tax=Hymenobacter negativus TaxID=2795026 RepID=A0ABS3QHY1_9BACT|nr:hypothetical protein [Hymenobacter negativus]MBO2010862.1 hypothetical protein [Hymenobacter negativus]
MGQENVVVLRVQLDEGETEKQIAKVASEIEATKKAQAALTKERELGRLSDEAYNQQAVKLQLQLKGQQQEQSALTKTLTSYRAMMTSATGSVDQLKAKAALLTTQYNALSESERTTSEAGKVLTAELEATNKALLEAGQKVGDNRRGVGAYKEAILGAAKESGLFGSVTERLSGVQEKYAAAQKLTAFVTAETTGVTKALRVAFLAIPLFAVIALLGTLYTFLTSTQKGMDFVERKTAAVGAAFSVLLKIVAPIGEAMLRVFTDPKQAVLDLVSFLETNVANRFKAFGVLVDAIRNRDFGKLTDGLIQLTTGITDGTAKAKALVAELGNAATAQEQLTGETQRIRAAERALNVERDESRAKIESLKKLSDDSTKSTAVRAVAAKQAAQIENGLLAAQLKLQQDKINNLQAEQRIKGNITNEDKQAMADLRSERAKTIQESETLSTELQNKINSLATEAAAKTEAARKALDEAMLKRIEAENAAGLSREAAAAKFLDDQLKGDQLRIASNQRVIDEKKAQDSAALQADIALLTRSLETRRLAIEQSYGDGKVSKQEYENQLQLIEQGSVAARIVLAKHYSQDTTALERQAAQAKIAAIEKVAEKEKSEHDKRIALAEQMAGNLLDIFYETVTTSGATIEDFAKRSLEMLIDSVRKEVYAAQIKILVNSFATADSIATFGATGGFRALGIIAAVTAATAPLEAALKQSQAKFAQGGLVVDGPSHAQGGVQLWHQNGAHLGELEGGEAVINKRSTSLFLPILSHLNELGGGRALLPAGPLFRHMALGGIAAPLLSQQGGGPSVAPIDYARLGASVAEALRKNPPVTKWSDFKAAEGRAAYTDSIASS